jgi:amino acid transporter
MIPEEVRQVFVFLEKVGLEDVILPFLIAFALLYGVFEKIRIFGVDKKGEPNTKVNLVVAALISITFVVSLNLVMMMTKIIWIFTVVIVGVLFMVMLMGLFGADLHSLFEKKEKK